MVCIYFLILIPLITATRRFNGPSYRSNIMEGNKPILRMSPNAGHEESNSDEGTQPNPPPKTQEPALVNDLGHLVKWLMENFSYDVATLGRKNNDVKHIGKPILRMPLNDTIDSDSDEDVDKVASEIETTKPLPLTENPVQPPVEPSEESEDPDSALRTKHEKKEPKEEESNSEWMKELKEFIKELTTQYGQREVLERAKPVIASLEKKHRIKIKDIDVDEYGEVHITYVKKGKGKKTARQRKRSDET